MNTDISISTEASADGKRNAFAKYCSFVEHNKNFAVCLNLIERRKQGELDASYTSCSNAISNRVCQALQMRNEELDVGHAIYFIERERSGEYFDARSMIPTASVVTQKTEKVSFVDKIKTTSYADVISASVQASNFDNQEEYVTND